MHILIGVNSIAAASDNHIQVQYAYGRPVVLESLLQNSTLALDGGIEYSDIQISSDFKITADISAFWGLEITDYPHEFIGTRYSRPDYPLSTGRVQRSGIKYKSELLTINIGRDDMISGDARPSVLPHPISGDGFSWELSKNNWSFRHVYQSLHAETDGNQTFRRSISYHHLSHIIGNYEIGVGEYFILTGNQLGLDLKRLNPFVPYARNSHDSVSDIYPGYAGDSDNALIKLFSKWTNGTTVLSSSIYIDEFQVDQVDREVYSDALLFNLSCHFKSTLFSSPISIFGGFSASNPNFGQHPGPFTTTTNAQFPLFEYSPGMTSLLFFETDLEFRPETVFFLAFYHERWVDLSDLQPQVRNLRAVLDAQKKRSEKYLIIQLDHGFTKLPLAIGIRGWASSENGSGAQLNLSAHHGW